MKITDLKTHNNSHERAFEAFCNQLFERWVRRESGDQLKYFTTVRGDGGDGGVEAYAVLQNEDVIGVQSKWFPLNIESSQINQIKSSIETAIKIRPSLKKYIICLPKDLTSLTGKNKDKTNTEEGRIKSMVDTVSKQFQSLTLIFWTEHILLEQLQISGNEGIRRFWFEKEELSQEALIKKFEIERAGWLKERYVPKLHLGGEVESEIEELLATPEARKRHLDSIENDLRRIYEVKALIDKFNGKVQGFPINQLLTEIYKNLSDFEGALQALKDTVSLSSSVFPAFIEVADLLGAKSKLEKGKFGNQVKNLKDQLSEELEKLHQANLPYWLDKFLTHIAPHNLILMGDPGMGKTHTLAFAVEKRLQVNCPALIIQAKGTPGNSWFEILRHGLGGLSTWTFDEICTALEALAARTDAYRAFNQKDSGFPSEQTCVLISVDGVDEVPCKDYPIWKNRLNEIRAIIKLYPRLRFLISCRAYGFQDANPVKIDFDDEINRRIDLSEGQRRTKELAPHYFQEYRIHFHKLNWLTAAFRTLLELRLFCETYEGQDVSKIVQPVHTTLGYLLQEKISRMEKEFGERFSPPWTGAEQVFKKALLSIAEIFENYKGAKHDSLCNEIHAKSNGVIDRNWSSQIVEFICRHGFLLQHKKLIDDVLGTEEIIYSATNQPYIDFLISLKASGQIGREKAKSLPAYLRKSNQNVLNLTAVSLLNDFGILIGEDSFWVDDFDEFNLHFMQYQALSGGSVSQIQSRLPVLEARFKSSREHQASILQAIILPHAGNKSLKLEREFIHEILSSYSNSFERDLIWSGDEYHRENSEGIPSPSEILQQIHRLEKHQAHDEQPLLFAWGLSAVDNQARKHFRKELTKWGSWNIGEFVKLLDLVFFCKDPQIQEDLATIGLGIASLTRSAGKGLDLLATWMLSNVFGTEASQQIKNSVVRYGARAVVERAFQFGEVSLEGVEKARPPYCSSHDLLPLDLSALTVKGSYPIGNDLEWYVIDDSYKGFLELGTGDDFEPFTAKILKPYHEYHGLIFGPKQWAMATAKAFIYGLGFNRSDGNTWTQESHGSLSKVMTFEEKYVWLAVHEIQGYLADLTPFDEGDDPPAMLKDYSRIVHVPNPVGKQMLMTMTEVADFGLSAKVAGEGQWFVPEEIAPILNCKEANLKNDLLAWVDAPQQPDFQLWIKTGDFFKDNVKQEKRVGVALSGYLSLAESNMIGRTSLRYICFLMDEEIQESFVKNFQKNQKRLSFYFHNLDFFKASTASIYFSPDDLVWMNWVSEEQSKHEFEISNVGKDPFEIINTVTRVTDRDATEGEESFKLPSKLLREELGIVSMGFNSFFDAKENQVAWALRSGKNYYDNQDFLFVDAKLFDEMLVRCKLKPLWVFFQFKATTAELKKDHQDAHAQNCKLWLVWEEKGDYKSLNYHDGWFRNEHSPVKKS